MSKRRQNQNVQWYYISRNTNQDLLQGISVLDNRHNMPIVIWARHNTFSLARRFSSVDNAIRYIETMHLSNVSIVDKDGNVFRENEEEAHDRL